MLDLQVGMVFLLMCQTCKVPKPKFFVVAQLEPLRFFLINSKATPFQMEREYHMETLAPIEAAENSFLHHDSFVGCNEVFTEYTRDALNEAYRANSRVLKGGVGPKARLAIQRALINNTLLKRGVLRELKDVWGC